MNQEQGMRKRGMRGESGEICYASPIFLQCDNPQTAPILILPQTAAGPPAHPFPFCNRRPRHPFPAHFPAPISGLHFRPHHQNSLFGISLPRSLPRRSSTRRGDVNPLGPARLGTGGSNPKPSTRRAALNPFLPHRQARQNGPAGGPGRQPAARSRLGFRAGPVRPAALQELPPRTRTRHARP
jgi:hypothetical protein